MTVSQKQVSSMEIYEFDRALELTINTIKKELSRNNQKIILYNTIFIITFINSQT